MAEATRLLSQMRNEVGELTEATMVRLNFSAECFHRFGYHREASEVIAFAEADARKHVLSSVDGDVMEPEGQRRLLVERVAMLLNDARARYHGNQFEQVIETLRVCGRAVDKMGVGGADGAAVGLRWRIAYTRGQVRRDLGYFDDAHTDFSEAVALAYHRMASHLERGKRVGGIESGPLDAKSTSSAGSQEFDAADSYFQMLQWSLAKSLALGLGSVYYHQGRLGLARTLTTAGRVILAATRDWVHRAHADLLLARVRRAEVGPSPIELRGTIERLTEVRDSFARDPGADGHLNYLIQAEFELAHAHLYSGNLPQAQSFIEGVLNHGRKQGSARWQSLALAVQSRILLGSGDPAFLQDALNAATSALNYAELMNDADCRVQSLIAIGEAEVASAREERATGRSERAAELLERAESHFGRALELGAQNPKTQAVCHLHLARVAGMALKSREAENHWTLWHDRLSQVVEAGWVRWYARQVREELDRDAVFTLPQELDYVTSREKLQQFLLRRAHAESDGSVADGAKKLGVSRQTYTEWMRKYLPEASS